VIQVFCAGNHVADVQVKPLSELPPPDVVGIADEIELVVGGNASNAAACLALLGVGVSVLGRVGTDPFGEFLVSALGRLGVETGSLRRDSSAPTSATVGAIDGNGARRCAHLPGVTARFTAEDFDWARIAKEMEPARTSGLPVFLHLSSFFLLPGIDGSAAAGILRCARQLGLATSLDVCWDTSGRWAQEIRPCLPYCDYVFPNHAEAREITGLSSPEEMTQWFLDNGAGAAIVKLGAEGCVARTSAGLLRIPAYRTQVVDTTGAGDALAAGFLAGRIWQWDLAQAMRFGCATAAISVTGFGASRALRSKEQVLELIERAKASG
jgi:sugar/nucleoside kinase (ribokinase family)